MARLTSFSVSRPFPNLSFEVRWHWPYRPNKLRQMTHRYAHYIRQARRSRLLEYLELQRFAEVGRVSAYLLHDIANPLMAASFNLSQAEHDRSQTIVAARKNLQQAERYVRAAQQQLKQQGQIRPFSIRRELQTTLLMLRPLAVRQGVRLEIAQAENYQLRGDPVKFQQVVANLVANAIDAYEGVAGENRRVLISVERRQNFLQLIVTDWGKGIAPASMARLFEPFYTTKTGPIRGLGIGLTMVKQAVEQDFGGTIAVSSSPQNGTQFVIRLRNHP